MAPPADTFHLDAEAISGICGSISIACWVVVFSPQIIQHFQSGSADALSIHFIIAWLLGDVFNILGAVLQGVLPTMLILAVYYTIADVVLLSQLFYYRGITWRDEPTTPKPRQQQHSQDQHQADERTALLAAHADHVHRHRHRRGSDWSGFSPAVPHVPDPPLTPPTTLQTIAWNTVVVIMVCVAGVAGWFLGRGAAGGDEGVPPPPGDVEFNTLGQVFGYLCAALYIASRLPQLILNWRRKTTEGLSMLFFLFACLGNVTYVLSIVVYQPRCRGGPCEGREATRLYGKYLLVNLSWILGSAVTLLLDFGVFAQYFTYRVEREDEDDAISERPLLEQAESAN